MPEPSPSEDEAWAEIVDNYGDRPTVEEPPTIDPAIFRQHPSWQVFAPPPEKSNQAPAELDDWPEEEGFVPPEPPPIPRPTAERGLAWLGVFASPAILLVCLLAHIRVPSLISYALIASFIGGFCFLVVNLPREPRDPWDDGAQI